MIGRVSTASFRRKNKRGERESGMNFIELHTTISRVKQMEQYLDEVLEAMKESPAIIDKDVELQKKITVLSEYYDSGQWLKDYECDERGELPKGLKRGVLAQDTLFNLFADLSYFLNDNDI